MDKVTRKDLSEQGKEMAEVLKKKLQGAVKPALEVRKLCQERLDNAIRSKNIETQKKDKLHADYAKLTDEISETISANQPHDAILKKLRDCEADLKNAAIIVPQSEKAVKTCEAALEKANADLSDQVKQIVLEARAHVEDEINSSIEHAMDLSDSWDVCVRLAYQEMRVNLFAGSLEETAKIGRALPRLDSYLRNVHGMAIQG
jgi:exopolyphosphatase/pppGpp-phosphohydrolase